LRAAALLLLAGCQPFEAALCDACADDACGRGLACVDGICLPLECDDDVCAPRYQVCGLEPPPPMCGDEPPCGDGLECFDDACRAPVEVVAAWHHACVRWASGRVSCWGGNRTGLAGDPSAITARPHPVAGLDDVVELTAGIASTCVRRADGRVWCWGENDFGQLGRFTEADLTRRFQDSPNPSPVAGLSGATALGSALRTTCATTSAGLSCWGRGDDCLLGDRSPEPSAVAIEVASDFEFDRLVGGNLHLVARAGDRALGWGSDASGQLAGRAGCGPQDLGIDAVADVAAGADHTCVLDAEGRVRCFGLDHVGQAGGGAAIELPEPAVEVQAAAHFSCARLESGRIVCWGADEEGAVAAGEPDLVPESRGALSFAVGGGGFGCFLREDGTHCWGFAATGSLGGGPAVHRPRRLAEGPFAEVDVGTHAACALRRDGEVVCWGDNREGQLGRGARSRFEAPGEIPEMRARQIAVGGRHACALDADGTAWCWGDGFDSTPRRVAAPQLSSITSGWAHTCGLGVDGAVWCWGDNARDAVDPAVEALYVPLPTRVLLDPAAAVVAGGGSSCAALRSGEVRCWGGSHPEWALGELAGAGQLAVAVEHVCGLREGQAWCVGNNQYGQLGDGTARTPAEPVRVATRRSLVQVATSFFHNCAVDREGRVLCWGQDLQQGRLGLGATGDRPSPVEIPGLPPISSVSAGARSTCAVGRDGTLWCWGWDGRGLVTGEPPFRRTPERVTGLR